MFWAILGVILFGFGVYELVSGISDLVKKKKDKE